MKSKRLKYQIKLNYSSQVHTFYRYAYSKDQAQAFAICALCRSLGLNPGSLGRKNWDVNNCEVKEIVDES